MTNISLSPFARYLLCTTVWLKQCSLTVRCLDPSHRGRHADKFSRCLRHNVIRVQKWFWEGWPTVTMFFSINLQFFLHLVNHTRWLHLLRFCYAVWHFIISFWHYHIYCCHVYSLFLVPARISALIDRCTYLSLAFFLWSNWSPLFNMYCKSLQM